MFFTPQIPEITKPAWEWLTTVCYPTALMLQRSSFATSAPSIPQKKDGFHVNDEQRPATSPPSLPQVELETENPTWCPSVMHSNDGSRGIP